MPAFNSQTYLAEFINYEIHHSKMLRTVFKLDRVKELLRLLGNPQSKLKCLHIAGTKGKGSTCAFLASILKSAGYKVGLYTSPHLNDYRERIRVLPSSHPSGKDFEGMISEAELDELILQMKPAIKEVQARQGLDHLSFFEIYTVAALCHFVRRGVDYAVLETGLGGRLDATNVVEAMVSAITPISLEHTQYLGSTLTEIAGEKAGIIKKKGQWVVVAPQEAEVLKVIQKRCAEIGAHCLFLGKDMEYHWEGFEFPVQRFSVKGRSINYPDLKSHLLGPHQVINAATAIGMVECLREQGAKISNEAVYQGIEAAVWPGRFEVVGHQPWIVLDGAHNPASARALKRTIQDMLPGKDVTLILGISEDKNIGGIVKELKDAAARIVLTQADHPRAHRFETHEIDQFGLSGKCLVTNTVSEALKAARQQAQADEAIVVTGSLFVVGEARNLCTSSKA